jgi:hypothetical protein
LLFLSLLFQIFSEIGGSLVHGFLILASLLIGRLAGLR